MLRQLIQQYRASLLAILLLAGASGLATVMLLAAINELAASGVTGDAQPLWALLWLAALLAASAISQLLLARLGADLVAELRLQLSLRFLALDYERLAQRKHLVFGALIEDIGRLGPLVLLAPQLAYNVLLVLMTSVYLFMLSPPLLALLGALHGLTFVLSWAMERHTRSRFVAMRQREEKVFEYVRTLSEGKKELSLSRQRLQHFTDSLLRPAISRARELMYGVHLAWGLAESGSTALSYAAVLCVILIGNTVLAVPAAVVVQVVISSLFLVGPLSFLVRVRPQVAMGRASLQHLQTVGLDLTAPVPAVIAAPAAPYEWQRLRARGLCYHYAAETADETRRGVGPIDLELRRGETVFITGGNGSGKSTLLLLLCALLRPTAGSLEVDGHSVWDAPEAWRDGFAAVFADFFLFAHVLDANGQLLPDDEIDALLQRLRLAPLVTARDGELSKLNVSSGQRKRLALLHCYAQNRSVVVLDEWAADQDPQFREHFYREVLPELQRAGKTLLVISHDDRYFHLANRVLTLEAGRLRADTARGTHDVMHEVRCNLPYFGTARHDA